MKLATLVLLLASYAACAPTGCTSTVFSFVYHGFAQLEEGIVGTLPVAYIFSPGSATNSPPPTTFTAGSWVTGGVYTRRDSVAVHENIRNANEEDVSLVIRTRIMLNATNGTVAGTLTMDNVSVAISKAYRKLNN
ncbi:hypothetical protein GE09DRAFT_1191494 [Coniochaeta sp. 2T2.1]|nr:hypothetical protein GE09DRAFT_1191494 [Coniochaeta sp. 2T2.1]